MSDRGSGGSETQNRRQPSRPGKRSGPARSAKAPAGHEKTRSSRSGGKSRTQNPQADSPQANGGLKGSGTNGRLSRDAALAILTGVFDERRPLSDILPGLFAKESRFSNLEPRDRAFARAAAAAALRYARPLQTFLAAFLEKPLPERHRRVGHILLLGAAQLLEQRAPAHAVIKIAVDQVRRKRSDAHLDRLTNAVLRRVSESEPKWAEMKTTAGPEACLPEWMWRRWCADYGVQRARALAAAALSPAALDITAKDDPPALAHRLSATLLTNGTVRMPPGGRIEELAGFREGAWWVQDAASSIPAHLFGDLAGRSVIDLCAAPGGKTAQLAASGAIVTAVDSSAHRLKRLKENLSRLKLDAKIVEADATAWHPDEACSAILLDAPCSATGTLRRHPDILHLKNPQDAESLVDLQSRLLTQALSYLAPGGVLIYCTCALEKDEGERQVAQLLQSHPDLKRKPVRADEAGLRPDWITLDGDVRILPDTEPVIAVAANSPHPGGIDGFFIARLTRV